MFRLTAEGTGSIYLDYCLVKPYPGKATINKVDNLPICETTTITEILDEDEDAVVMKKGQTTGLTRERIMRSLGVMRNHVRFPGKTFRVYMTIDINGFQQGSDVFAKGDSGGPVVRRTKALGIVLAVGGGLFY